MRRKFSLEDTEIINTGSELVLYLLDISTAYPLSFHFKVLDLATHLTITLKTPDLELASELIQDFANSFKIWDMPTKCHFPSLA
jgi:hypothetical protein